jgi:glyoxylase-like metal-dependent hydrolase (beta-lactamase superfamily II)
MSKIHILDLHFQHIPHTIAAFLIETNIGPVLIETGPYSTFSYLTKAINTAGFEIEDIKHVFLSHIHLDHAGAAWAFAEKGANIYLHPFGAKNMADPSRLMESAKMIYKDKMDELWGDMKAISKAQLIEVGDEEEINIGDVTLKSWHTPGHAKHHIAWQLEDVVFSGDVAGVKIDGGIVVPPCPPPDIDIEGWKNSTQLLRSLNPKTIYLTHFAGIENINEHLDALDDILDNWAAWVKAHWMVGETNEQMVPQFMDHVARQLRKAGLGEDEIKKYEAANPSWMSVAGLVRYWTKKREGKL